MQRKNGFIGFVAFIEFIAFTEVEPTEPVELIEQMEPSFLLLIFFFGVPTVLLLSPLPFDLYPFSSEEGRMR